MISESDFDQDTITPELVPENQLQVLVKDLEPTKANFFIDKFADHVKMAAEWAKKAKAIIVTDENQTVLMKQAKVARLFLREKRIEIENTRKALKADALKEGQAIDKISNFLKDLITPTELHLERQEKFVEFREAAKAEVIRLEVEAKMEADRLAKEKEDAQALARLNEENKALKLKQQMAEEVAEKLRLEQEALLQEERNKTLRIERELQIRKSEELKKEADKIREAEALAKAGDSDFMIILRKQLIDIKIPQFQSFENQRIAWDVKSYIGLAILKIKIQEE